MAEALSSSSMYEVLAALYTFCKAIQRGCGEGWDRVTCNVYELSAGSETSDGSCVADAVVRRGGKATALQESWNRVSTGVRFRTTSGRVIGE